MSYSKSQTGWIIIGLMSAIIILIVLLYIFQWGTNTLSLMPFLALLSIFSFLMLLFYQLTVELDGSVLKVIYGIGIITIRFRIDELLDTEVIKTPWYYGWGIRITPKGMLYNIYGPDAVRIKFTHNGKKKSIMVGSPEPEKLQHALEVRFGHRSDRDEIS